MTNIDRIPQQRYGGAAHEHGDPNDGQHHPGRQTSGSHKHRSMKSGEQPGLQRHLSNENLSLADFEAEIAKIKANWNRDARGDGGDDESQLNSKKNDQLAVIAQSAGSSFSSISELLASPTPAKHPICENAEKIVQRLVDRMESIGGQAIAGSKVHLTLDKTATGLSGLRVNLTAGALTVVLEGISAAASAEVLASAGQALVSQLQKHYPGHRIRILAKPGIDSEDSPDDREVPLIGRRGNEAVLED